MSEIENGHDDMENELATEVWGRSRIKAAGLADAHLFPDEIREEFAKPKWKGMWLSAFEARLRRNERDAVRLYAEIMKIVGQQMQVAVNFWLQVGARDQQDAARLIGTARKMEQIDAHTLEDMTLIYIRERSTESEDFKARVKAMIE